MIKKVGKSFFVVSHNGKRLGGPYPTKEKAEERLREVEYFKHKDKEKK